MIINSFIFGSSAPDIITDGLYLNLDAGDVASYPGTGTTWYDISGMGNDCTLVNAPSYTTTNGGELNFNGTDTYVTTPIYPTQNNMTLELWINDNNSPATNRALWFSEPWVKLNIASDNTLRWRINNSGTDNVYSTATTNNTWYNVTVRYQVGEPLKIFLNGVLNATSGVNSAALSSVAVLFSLFTGTGYSPLNGKCAVARAYSKAFSDAEVLQNFDALKSRYGY